MFEKFILFCLSLISFKDKKARWNNRAEFYIISALIMIAIISALSTKANVAYTAPSPVKFYDLSDNFEKEGYKIIDTYVFQGSPSTISAQIENFTTNFLQYAREKDPNVGLVYIYGNETDVLISNHANEPVDLKTSSGETSKIESPDIISISNITIDVSGKPMTKDVAQRAAMFNVLSQAFHTKSDTKWVVLNIAGALYPFNTADDKNFYVVVVTTQKNETFVDTTPDSGTCKDAEICTDVKPICKGTLISTCCNKINNIGCAGCVDSGVTNEDRKASSKCTCENMNFPEGNIDKCKEKGALYICSESTIKDYQEKVCCTSCSSG